MRSEPAAGRPVFLDDFWRIFSGLAAWFIFHTFYDVGQWSFCNDFCKRYGLGARTQGRVLTQRVTCFRYATVFAGRRFGRYCV